MARSKGVERPRFGGIRALKSGRFQARYRRDGRTYTGPDTFGSEADAWAWLATVEASMVTGQWRPGARSTTTLDSYAQKWIAEHPRLKDSTRALYANDYRLHVEPYLGHLALRELTPALVREWHARLRADLKAEAIKRRAKAEARAAAQRARAKARAAAQSSDGRPADPRSATTRDARAIGPRSATTRDGSATAARCYRLLRAICSGALKDHEIQENPCQLDGAGSPESAAGADERPTLSAAEVAMLADAVPPRYRALVLVLAWAGLRIGEATALRRDDVDLTPGHESLRVSERVIRIPGAGWNYDTPKSRAGRRRVPVPPHVAAELVEHLDTYTGADGSALVFPTRTGATSREVAGAVITRRLNDMGRDDVRVHDLRHTGQVMAAVAGATQSELMRRMGHSSTVAAQGYAHAVEDHGRAVADLLSQIAEGATVVPLASRRRRARNAS